MLQWTLCSNLFVCLFLLLFKVLLTVVYISPFFYPLTFPQPPLLCISFCMNTCFSILLGKYLSVDLLSHMVSLCWTSEGTAKLFFQSSSTISHYCQQFLEVPVSPYSCQQLLLSVFCIIDILVDRKWYFIRFWFAIC